MGQWVNEPVLSLQWLRLLPWLRFGPWPRNFHMPRVQKKNYDPNNKDLLYAMGNYIQHPVITYNGKESGKVYISIYKYI